MHVTNENTPPSPQWREGGRGCWVGRGGGGAVTPLSLLCSINAETWIYACFAGASQGCGGSPLAGLGPIRDSAERQSVVRSADAWISSHHQPQQNGSPYLLTVLSRELCLLLLSLSLILLSVPLPFLKLPPSLCKQTSSVDTVMGRWVSLSNRTATCI